MDLIEDSSSHVTVDWFLIHGHKCSNGDSLERGVLGMK